MNTLNRMGLILSIALLTSLPSVWAEPPPSDSIQWKMHCVLDDGRRVVTDGSFLLDSRFMQNESIPEKSIPPQSVQRLFQSPADKEFTFGDLKISSNGNYMAPGSILLSRKYLDYLGRSPMKRSIKFRAKAPNAPVLIVDGDTVVGVIMPMKT